MTSDFRPHFLALPGEAHRQANARRSIRASFPAYLRFSKHYDSEDCTMKTLVIWQPAVLQAQFCGQYLALSNCSQSLR
jgi:hypothetical protein